MQGNFPKEEDFPQVQIHNFLIYKNSFHHRSNRSLRKKSLLRDQDILKIERQGFMVVPLSHHSLLNDWQKIKWQNRTENRLRVFSGMHILHSFSNGLDAKKLQMCWNWSWKSFQPRGEKYLIALVTASCLLDRRHIRYFRDLLDILYVMLSKKSSCLPLKVPLY